MNVHIAFRPGDCAILGVFSSRKGAEECGRFCSGLDRDIEISDYHVEGDCETVSDPEDAQFTVEEQCRSGWIG